MTACSYQLDVKLGDRSYPIFIVAGCLQQAGERLRKLKSKGSAFIVADGNVAALYAENLLQSLQAADVKAKLFQITPGEASKSFTTLETLVADLVKAGIERNDAVIAFGGGVIGDLAGFAAAITLRGVDFVQIPTTLLAQVDSSVGGKTGINLPQGKNLIGAFHQPKLVLIDPNVLDTLDKRQLRAGYAEIVKLALINDPAFFDWLEEKGEEVFANTPARAQAIHASCRRKAEIVARDERESHERMLLNLGHTFGHALEAINGYSDQLPHGEAVAIGVAMAFRFSHKLGLCGIDDAKRVENHLQKHCLPISAQGLPGVDADKLLQTMSKDKKVTNGRFTFILARAIGNAFVARDVEVQKLAAFLQDDLQTA